MVLWYFNINISHLVCKNVVETRDNSWHPTQADQQPPAGDECSHPAILRQHGFLQQVLSVMTCRGTRYCQELPGITRYPCPLPSLRAAPGCSRPSKAEAWWFSWFTLTSMFLFALCWPRSSIPRSSANVRQRRSAP